MTPTVFVVDDDEDMRHSLQMLISAMGYPVQTFASAGQFRRFYTSAMPGCLLLDVRMPRQSGLELYEQLIREQKRLPVIFITAHADVPTAVAAIKTGAVEFLEKPFDGETLQTLLEKALQRDADWRRRDAEITKVDQQIATLTERERETLTLVMAGESNKSMAAKLFVTERAVEMRRARIMQKLGVRSLAELLDLTITHRVLSELRESIRQQPNLRLSLPEQSQRRS
ncbi:MAG: response regulator [Pirellulaceae bacterium]